MGSRIRTRCLWIVTSRYMQDGKFSTPSRWFWLQMNAWTKRSVSCAFVRPIHSFVRKLAGAGHHFGLWDAAWAEVFKRSCVKGYHVYKDVWTVATGEELVCQREQGNAQDIYAVAVIKDDTVVGHLAHTISRFFSVLKRRWNISVLNLRTKTILCWYETRRAWNSLYIVCDIAAILKMAEQRNPGYHHQCL